MRAGLVLLIAVAIAGCGSSESPSSTSRPLASEAAPSASRPADAPPPTPAETVPTLLPSLASGFRVHAYEIVSPPLAELHGTQSATYHGIHVSQLRALAKMTGDSFFADFADLLEADHP